jgi:membrane protein YdbS with pleckstrin-like domain
MSNATNAGLNPAATDSLGNVAPAQDQEVIFYEGSPKLRGESGLLFKCFVGALVLVLIAIAIGYFSTDSSVKVWAGVICGLLAAIVFFAPMILVRKNRYRISNYRIDHEQGLLSKRIDTIELWHVDDVQMIQSFVDRLLGVGTINVHSNDATSPVLPLRSLPQPRKLYDAIKQRVIAVKRQRGVMKFDGGSHAGDAAADMGDHHHPSSM